MSNSGDCQKTKIGLNGYTAIRENVIPMCRSSYVYNLTFVLCNLQRHGRRTSKRKQGVNLAVMLLKTPYILRKTVLLYESLKAG